MYKRDRYKGGKHTRLKRQDYGLTTVSTCLLAIKLYRKEKQKASLYIFHMS